MTTFIRTHIIFLSLITISISISLITLLFQSIRLDEAQTIWIATKSPLMILQIDSQDVVVPAYELLLHVWMQIIGATVIAARLLSFLFFLATLPYLYLLGKEAGNAKIGMIAVTLFSLSPFIMWYSSEARMYSLFAFATVLSHVFFIRFVRTRGRSSKISYLLSSILGIYTHYFFVFLLITQVVFLIALRILRKDYEFGVKNRLQFPANRFARLLATHLMLLIIAALFFLPWIIYFIHMGGAANTQPLIPPPTSYTIFQSFVNFLFGFQSNSLQSIIISLWPIFVLSLFIFFTKNEKESVVYSSYFALATFLPIILVFIASFIRPIFLSRYLILVTPTLFFLIAWMTSGYRKRGSQLLLSFMLLIMFILLVYQNISTTTPVKENYQGVANYLQIRAAADDIIAISAPFTIYPIEYLYQGNTKIDTIPQWDRYAHGAIPTYTHAALVNQINSYKLLYTHIFVVLSYDQGYEKDIIYYLDKHFKRNDLKTFSPGLMVREYQLRYDTFSGRL